MTELTLAVKCDQLLNQEWQTLLEKAEKGVIEDVENDPLTIQKIRQTLISRSKSYHYVLLTQLLAKVADGQLDCRSLQAGSFPYDGAFDARTVAHKVVVPFDIQNQNVLGGSAEPYVNNPLRVPGILKEYVGQQKYKDDWKLLIEILETVEKDSTPSAKAKLFLQQTLTEILRLTQDSKVIYAMPSRVSLYRTLELLNKYLQDKSGGERLESIATALFRTIGHKFKLYDEVKREKVNAADNSSDMAGDIECRLNGKIVLLVEVRDKKVTLSQIENSLFKVRSKQITELLFLAQQGFSAGDVPLVEEKQQQEFASGQNVYSTTLTDLANACMIILGEQGRSEFIRQIGLELDRINASISHRKAWANLLKTL